MLGCETSFQKLQENRTIKKQSEIKDNFAPTVLWHNLLHHSEALGVLKMSVILIMQNES